MTGLLNWNVVITSMSDTVLRGCCVRGWQQRKAEKITLVINWTAKNVIETNLKICNIDAPNSTCKPTVSRYRSPASFLPVCFFNSGSGINFQTR